MIKRIEVFANLAVIVTSVVLCSVLIKKYFFSPKGAVATAVLSSSANAPNSSALQPGTKISLPGIDWSNNSRTVVLALSTSCHFCSESGPFYQQLEHRKPATVGLVAVLPQSVEDSRKYLQGLGVKTAHLVQSSLGSIGVSGTPTLLLVDQNGSLIASWVGKLPPSEVPNLVAQINH